MYVYKAVSISLQIICISWFHQLLEEKRSSLFLADFLITYLTIFGMFTALILLLPNNFALINWARNTEKVLEIFHVGVKQLSEHKLYYFQMSSAQSSLRISAQK